MALMNNEEKEAWLGRAGVTQERNRVTPERLKARLESLEKLLSDADATERSTATPIPDARGALSVISDELSALYGKTRGLEQANEQLRDALMEATLTLDKRNKALALSERLRADEERANEVIFSVACLAGAIFVIALCSYWFTMT